MKIIFSAFVVFLGLSGCGGDKATESSSYWLKQAGEHPRTVVVFIHGVLGDSRTTWGGTQDGQGWPEIVFSDPSMPKADVLSVGFRSKPVSEGSNIEEIAVRTLSSIQDEGVFKDYENVIFVAHSMGGLITKRMLRIEQIDHPSNLQKTKAVLFFSTPSQGSDLSEMASWVSGNPQFDNMRPADFNAFLQVLDNDWQGLKRSRSSDMPFPRVFCAYETLSTSGMKVVPRSNSESACDETPIPFDKDHVGIVKPVSADDALHKYLRKRIIESIDPMLVPQKISFRLVKADGDLLSKGESLRSGEQYFIELRAQRPVWFYTFGIDSTDRVDRYFPTAGASGPRSNIRIPEENNKYLTLDHDIGLERIYIFALDSPSQELADTGFVVGDEAKSKLDKISVSLRGSYIAPRYLAASGETQLSVFGRSASDVIMFEHKP